MPLSSEGAGHLGAEAWGRAAQAKALSSRSQEQVGEGQGVPACRAPRVWGGWRAASRGDERRGAR